MTNRRALILAGAAVAAAAAAEGLRPRRRLKLMEKGTVEASLPKAFASWTSTPADSLVDPRQAGRLARTLYSEIVQRIYTSDELGAAVMLLAAYGDTQSDLLQLHRPEECYPAVGYAISQAYRSPLTLAKGAVLPARHVVAEAGQRRENILYWTRLGERLPDSAGEQRLARFRNSVDGYVADGILMRTSIVGDTQKSFDLLSQFVPTLIAAIAPDRRPIFLGTKLARSTDGLHAPTATAV